MKVVPSDMDADGDDMYGDLTFWQERLFKLVCLNSEYRPQVYKKHSQIQLQRHYDPHSLPAWTGKYFSAEGYTSIKSFFPVCSLYMLYFHSRCIFVENMRPYDSAEALMLCNTQEAEFISVPPFHLLYCLSCLSPTPTSKLLLSLSLQLI